VKSVSSNEQRGGRPPPQKAGIAVSKDPSGKPGRAVVESIDHRGPSVVVLRLVPLEAPFDYREGQYLSVALPGTSEHRSYSMAAPCSPTGAIELHIRLHEKGLFSTMLREQIKIGTSLTMSGPYGNCVWDVPENVASTVLLLATGTGIAPLKAIAERHVPAGGQHDIWLYWGGETPEDLYAATELQSLAKAFPHFHFVPVLRTGDDGWKGATGFVQDVAASTHPDLSETYVFACGAPMMVQMARELFVSCNGLLEDRFNFDSFESSVNLHAAKVESWSKVRLFASLPDGSVHPVQCRIGQTLMSSLVSEKFVEAICGGNQSCGTCRVTVGQADFSNLPELSRSERRLLATLPGSSPFDRLSCQLEVCPEHEGMFVNIPPSEF
jgi:CDP-4-dehydro-6-deoxyglucose reductase, E3